MLFTLRAIRTGIAAHLSEGSGAGAIPCVSRSRVGRVPRCSYESEGQDGLGRNRGFGRDRERQASEFGEGIEVVISRGLCSGRAKCAYRFLVWFDGRK